MSETFLRQSVVDALWQAGGPSATEEDKVEAVIDVFRPCLSRVKSLEGELNELRTVYDTAMSRVHDLNNELANLRVRYDQATAGWSDTIDELNELRWGRGTG